MQWMKAIYEAYGVHYPRVSLVVVFAIGGLIAAGGWRVLAYQVEKETRTSTSAPISAGSITTSGENSPVITGSGNSVTNDQPSQEDKKPKPPK
jgi:hypothetical protein